MADPLPEEGATDVAIVLQEGWTLTNGDFAKAPTTSHAPLRFLKLLDHLGGPGTSGPRDGLHASRDGLMTLLLNGAGFRELLAIAPVL